MYARYNVAMRRAAAFVILLAGCTPEAAPPVTGVCAHPFFPVRAGAAWVYDSGPDTRIVDKILETRTDGFTIERRVGDARSTERWSCTREGLRRVDQLPADMLAGSFDTRWNTERLVGLDLARTFSPGARWTLGLTVHTTTRAPGTAEWQRRMTSDHVFVVGRRERVTVPAGTFDAVPVRETITRTLERPTGDNPAPNVLVTTTWWARDVGWVKRRVQRTQPATAPAVTTQLVQATVLPPD